MTQVRLSMICVFFFAVYVGLEIRERAPGSHASSLTTTSPTTSPESEKPFVWDVSLDPAGRPYDVELLPGSRIARRPLAVLHAPSRLVLFMGGEYLPSPETSEPDVKLAERQGQRYPVHAIWELRKRKEFNSIVGVVVVERETPIVRWKILDDAAYFTDGGTGGITTYEWALQDKPYENEVFRLYDSELGKGRQHFAGDVDGYPGIDTIGFSNGWGDGAFPSIAGYDAAGERVEIVLWTKVVPWRLAFPQGKPPAIVTRTENEFAQCVKGLRRVDGSRCRVSR